MQVFLFSWLSAIFYCHPWLPGGIILSSFASANKHIPSWCLAWKSLKQGLQVYKKIPTEPAVLKKIRVVFFSQMYIPPHVGMFHSSKHLHLGDVVGMTDKINTEHDIPTTTTTTTTNKKKLEKSAEVWIGLFSFWPFFRNRLDVFFFRQASKLNPSFFKCNKTMRFLFGNPWFARKYFPLPKHVNFLWVFFVTTINVPRFWEAGWHCGMEALTNRSFI